ncbi:DUF6381 family protein [Streptomyces xanthochromogenes]|uniref:Small hydrophilic protein n=1 Tax=Streptomyces xanthochromogenes TaxID=67384 RepID=A0ABQ3ALV4_9ACTN|nr:DUF6381 family protein [Streptomyces xanthochromogenes]GGY61408.1 hypothetical protein GCM10010326_65270 [Streptomyces xanthochromogenes]
MNPTRELDTRRQQQMRSQLKELAHAADRALDPELRRRLEAKAHRLQQQYDQAADHGTPRLTS